MNEYLMFGIVFFGAIFLTIIIGFWLDKHKQKHRQKQLKKQKRLYKKMQLVNDYAEFVALSGGE